MAGWSAISPCCATSWCRRSPAPPPARAIPRAAGSPKARELEAPLHPHRARLAGGTQPHPAALLPLRPKLLGIRYRGPHQTWGIEGWMDGHEAYNALPPLGRARLRPGALTMTITP